MLGCYFLCYLKVLLFGLCIASTIWSILLRESRSLGDLRYEVAILLTSKRTPRGLMSFPLLKGRSRRADFGSTVSGFMFCLCDSVHEKRMW